MPLIIGSIVVVTCGLFIWFSERYQLLTSDRFPTRRHQITAYVWFTLFVALLASLVVRASGVPVTRSALEQMPFWSMFTIHFILLLFLFGWWMLSGRPRLGEFFNLRREGAGEATMTGLSVGVGGWLLTILAAMAIGLILKSMGLIGDEIEPSPFIPWMAKLPVWQKLTIIFSAMTVEELFYRAWLQKRIGLVLSTIFFAVSHAGLGQPLMLIGITVVSLIIGFTFYRTKNLLPCIVAHGVFDAIQLFVIIPIAIRFMPGVS